MPRYKMVNGVRIQFTAEEEKARDLEEQAWADGAPARRMDELRKQRNELLIECKSICKASLKKQLYNK